MPVITRSGNCGNSPKNRLVENVSVALATADAGPLADWVTEDVTWQIVGKSTTSGVAELADAVRRTLRGEPTAVIVEHVMTHGKAGAVNGRVTFEQGIWEFCDVYEFNSARGTHVKAIKSYRIGD